MTLAGLVCYSLNMKYEPVLIYIKNKVSGVEVKFTEDWDYNSYYLWSSGNFSCDCNRQLLFNRELGIETEELISCGNKIYEVSIHTLDGQPLYEMTING